MRPHIILVNPDQWRGDMLGHLGFPGARTPVLDALVAREAVSFRHALCQYTVCTPSRCSFMTGWYAHTFGHRDQHVMLRDADATILWNLRRAGWRVCWFGKNDLLPGEGSFAEVADLKHVPEPAPYPLYEQMRERRGAPGNDNRHSFFAGRIEERPGAPVRRDHDWQMVDAALRCIAGHDPARPLCLYLPLHHPHPPYGVEEPYFSAIDRAQVGPRVPTPRDWTCLPGFMRRLHEASGMQGWSEGRWNELRATYLGMCLRVDEQIGLIVEALRARGMWDDTALFVFADHGDYCGDYGLVQKDAVSLRPCLVEVPFVVRPPRGRTCVPGVRGQLVELVDLSATVYALAGVAPRWQGFGRSLLPVLADPGAPHRAAAFCEGGRARGATARPGPGDDLYAAGAAIDAEDGPEVGKAVLCRTTGHAYVRRLDAGEEIYDLREDPAMLRNLAASAGMRDVVERMRERTLDWLIATGDLLPPWRGRRE